jgi:beta-lactamase class A
VDVEERLGRPQGPRQDAGLTALLCASCLATFGGWQPDVAAARAYAADRPGAVSFAVRTEGRFFGHATHRGAPAASTLKALLLVAYLRRARDRPLTADDRRLLAPMVRRSDNVTATRVRNVVGDRALRGLGGTGFRAHRIWGLSTVTARGLTRFMLRVDRLVPPRHRAYALRLLRTIVPSQRWGIARVAPPGWRLYFKGGWGSGSGAVDHQVALLTRGNQRVSVAVMTTGNGSHAAGKATLRGVSARLLRGLDRVTG